MKTITIKLKQGENELMFQTAVNSPKINEIAGTLAKRVIDVKNKSKKFKLNFGVNFSRKFNIEFKIEGVDVDKNNFILNELFKANITINNQEKFALFVNEMIIELLTDRFMLETSIEELIEEIKQN